VEIFLTKQMFVQIITLKLLADFIKGMKKEKSCFSVSITFLHLICIACFSTLCVKENGETLLFASNLPKDLITIDSNV
jgi:hypothetical protein